MLEINNIIDLQNLISNQVEENLHLDYKAADALGKTEGKKKEISKDISAFANSDGGVVIYGIKEFNDPLKRHLPEAIDPLDRNNISKEWLEQVINSNISPRIENLKITPIPLNTTTSEVVYVVTVNKSTTAHQANDYRYYKRYNFESVAMYDFEVRDIMNRNKAPKIELSFEIEQYTYERKPYLPHLPTFQNPLAPKPKKDIITLNTLYVFGKNIGAIYANYVNSYVEVPNSLLDEKEYDHLDSFNKDGINYKKIYCDNTVREIKEANVMMGHSINKYWPSRYDPILPGISSRLKRIVLKSNTELETGIINWSVNADNAPLLTGQITITDIYKFQREPKKKVHEVTDEDDEL